MCINKCTYEKKSKIRPRTGHGILERGNKGITLHYFQPLKMELIHGSETSANYILTPGKYLKEHIQYNSTHSLSSALDGVGG